jgi:mono/diheme cytochrome c family protein
LPLNLFHARRHARRQLPLLNRARPEAGSSHRGSGAGSRVTGIAALVLLAAAVSACRQDMHDAPRYEPLEASTFFADGRSSRMLLANTVSRGSLREDRHLYEGIVNGQPAETFPMPVTAEVMARGHERFNVFCSPCHGRTGEGDGMIVQRGFRKPPSYHEDRLRNAPVGYFFDVMTHGFGAMQDYSAQLPVPDRWAIAAYIRALQFSQRASIDDVPADRRADLDRPAGAAAGEQQPPASAPGQQEAR